MFDQQSSDSYGARLRQFIETPVVAAAVDGFEHVDATADAFNRLALDLFAWQYAHNSPYRKWCQSRGQDPASVGHWTELPAVPTLAFREWELTCLPETERTAIFHSSGTTGQRPSRHYHQASSLNLYRDSLLPWFAAHVVPDLATIRGTAPKKIRCLLLVPPPRSAPHSSLVHMLDQVCQTFGTADSQFVGRREDHGAWTLDFPLALAILERAIQINQPVALLGTAFAFVQLLDPLAAERRVLALPTGSRIMETGGYKGRSRTVSGHELRGLMTRYLGVPVQAIVGEYGMCELSSQAYDWAVPPATQGAVCGLQSQTQRFQVQVHEVAAGPPKSPDTQAAPKRVFHFPPWARARVISPETGKEVADEETGLIQVVDLANVASVLAIQTEDLGIRRATGFELAGRAWLAETRGCSLMAGF